jgi:hypothetical protein
VNASDPGVGVRAAYERSDNARRIIASAASVLPDTSDLWSEVDRALADVPALGAVIARLTAELADTRMDRANLLAAMRATIGAQQDGEPDPLYYLRDELNARQDRPAGRGGPS